LSENEDSSHCYPHPLTSISPTKTLIDISAGILSNSAADACCC
jgi:hypothetical protein